MHSQKISTPENPALDQKTNPGLPSDEKKPVFTKEKILSILLGTAILSFGLYNIHQQSGITEGGVLGMILLLNHWFGLPPAILSPVLDLTCYALGFKFLGKDFLKMSIAATLSLAFFFWFWELFPPLLPSLAHQPLLAALAGGVFVGTGVSFVVRFGASSGGDDALALVISKLLRCRLARAYLVTDFTVLMLSLSYIPLNRIVFSLITVTVSSLLIDLLLRLFQKREEKREKKKAAAGQGPSEGQGENPSAGLISEENH